MQEGCWEKVMAWLPVEEENEALLNRKPKLLMAAVGGD